MVFIKSEEEIRMMSRACRIVAEALEAVRSAVRPGVSTKELEKIAEDIIRSKGGTPAFKGYKGYPSSICASVNSEVVHGIPSGRKLLEGDIVGIDLGVKYQGYFGDAAVSVPVGKISAEAERLLKVTEESLYIGIAAAGAGARISDISHAIQGHVERAGYSVVRAFVGHGIGRNLHEDPQVPNFGEPGKGLRLKKGMTLAIEPMVNAGGSDVRVLEDGWTAVTVDGSLSAHFEHTVALTENEAIILTNRELIN